MLSCFINEIRMDETRAAIVRGCRLARELEENIENIANQPEVLTRFCDEIIRVFSYVKDQQIINSYSAMLHHDPQDQWRMQSGSSSSQAMDHPHHHQQLHEPVMTGLPVNMMREIGGHQDQAVQPMEVSISAGRASSSSSSQRQRKRRDEGGKRIVRVAAPRMGNTEIPPEDGYTWRKYGQKDILNSNYPRSYFRCTHQKLYSCPAKKQVQRLNDDPGMYEVVYRGEHTCHLSSTAPSGQPPPAGQPPPTLPSPSSLPVPSLSQWLSMDMIRQPEEGPTSNVIINTAAGRMQMYSISTSRGEGAGAGAGAGPSSAPVTRLGVGEYQPVTDLADVMFNSGSSSNNSMDLIFPSIRDDKWDSAGEKK